MSASHLRLLKFKPCTSDGAFPVTALEKRVVLLLRAAHFPQGKDADAEPSDFLLSLYAVRALMTDEGVRDE